VVSVQPLVYQPGATVHILYPGTRVNPDGSIADVPGWNLNADGFWVRDPSDAFLRDGIHLHYEVNPSADAFVTYPPESSGCANPTGPFPPGATTTTVPGAPTPTGSLPHTGANENWTAGMAALVLAAGSSLLLIARRRRS
jgi:LPXTG-motif cell wall-anchored protein